jgi:hypothetical protein
MSVGFTNQPKILHGAFVEYGQSLPRLSVEFQFNPEKISRKRSLSFSGTGSHQGPEGESGTDQAMKAATSIRDFHGEYEDLIELRDAQQVSVQPETISFEIRLDATDKLNEGDPITEQLGISPQLATLELMTHPKQESRLAAFLGKTPGFSYSVKDNPPMILFIWGRKRALPVNINSFDITETEFNANLDPIRATVSVSLTVIEGPNQTYLCAKAMREQSAVVNLRSTVNIAHMVIPG